MCNSQLVPLSATGVGTSIIVGDLRDRVVLGRHFTKIPLNCKVIIENCGTRMHALEWSEHYKAPKTKQHARLVVVQFVFVYEYYLQVYLVVLSLASSSYYCLK